jgi:hypothetical protein
MNFCGEWETPKKDVIKNVLVAKDFIKSSNPK